MQSTPIEHEPAPGAGTRRKDPSRAMNPIASPDLLFAVDRLVLSDRRIFGWGWAAHSNCAIDGVQLRLETDRGPQTIEGGIGHSRDDVHAAHPHLRNAGTSGFVLTGFLPECAVHDATLRVVLEDGTVREHAVTSAIDNLRGARSKRRLISWILRASWRRLRRGDIGGILRRARAQHYGAPSLEAFGALGRLVRVLARARDICVLIDNNLGGGSNQYRRQAIAARVASGQTVVLCTYNLPVLQYRLHVFRPGHGEQVFRIPSFMTLDRIVAETPVGEIFVNSPVSFDDPLLLAQWLARVRNARTNLKLTLTAHDYFVVCPSFVLLDAQSKFCGVPELSRCSDCLRDHRASYVALSPPTDIRAWRTLWGHCLAAADEVRCFSNATRVLLLRAYPDIDPAKVTVVPHRMDFVPARRPRLDHGAPLVIGILGEISQQKGARLVQELVAEIERRRLPARVVVVGSLDVARRSPLLKVTGPYDRRELPDLIEAHGINMFLFPSIWPETFSYVVAELMLLEVPIVAFDLGAPAERLREYRLGRLCPEVGAPAALATLLDFHRELGLRDAAAA